jgi:lysozyme
MKLSTTGIELLAELEGVKLKPYLDSAGIPTIGIGNTYYPDGRKVTMQDKPILKQEAYYMAEEILNKDFCPKVLRLLPTIELTQNQFDALVLFAYNAGIGALQSSSLLKSILNHAPEATIRANWAVWNKATVKGVLTPLAGLTRRRQLEADLYFKK